jgi:transcriptional regulator with XRE-family HTH domain
MSKDEKERPLVAIVGERLKAFREEKGLRQADVAAAASKWGLPWARSSIAALEAGTRNLSVEEMLLLPFVISELGGWSSPLIPPDAWVALSSTRKIQAEDLRELAYGLTTPQADLNTEHPLTGTTLGVRRPGQVQADIDDELYSRQMFAEDMAWRLFCARMYPGMGSKGWAHSANLGNDLELVARVAKKIENPSGGTASYGLVNVLSWVLWRAPVEVERDRRTGLRGVLHGRGLQSAKGHVTRELTSELEAEAEKVWPAVNEIFGELAPIWNDATRLDEWAHRARSEATRLESAAYGAARRQQFAEEHPEENAALDEIGNEIKAGRAAAGLTHEQLADIILLDAKAIRRIEQGEYFKGRSGGQGRFMKDRQEERVRKYVSAISRAVGIDPAPLLGRYEEALRADQRGNA